MVARGAWFTPEPWPKHDGVRALERLSCRGLELLTERRFDGQYVGKTRLRGGDRFARGNQLHKAGSGGKGTTGGMECGPRHAVGAADNTDTAAIAVVHLRREPRHPFRRPRIGDEHGPCGVGRRKPDVDDHDLTAPLARKQVPTPWAAERHGDLRAYRSMRFTAREVEARRSIDRQNGCAVSLEPLREREHLALCRANRTGPEQRVDRDGCLRPCFFAPELAHTVEPR